jgi:hypothetical protein
MSQLNSITRTNKKKKFVPADNLQNFRFDRVENIKKNVRHHAKTRHFFEAQKQLRVKCCNCHQLYTIIPGTTLEKQLYQEFCRTGNAVSLIKEGECHSCRMSISWSISTGYLCMNDVSSDSDSESEENLDQTYYVSVLQDGFKTLNQSTPSNVDFNFKSMFKATNALRRTKLFRKKFGDQSKKLKKNTLIDQH